MNNLRIKSKSNKVIFSKILNIIANIIGVFLIIFGAIGALALFSSVQFKYDGVWFLVICLGGILILLKGKKKRIKRMKSEKTTGNSAFEHASENSSDKYADTLEKLHELNNDIVNEELSEKISRIELIVAHIFEIAEEQKKSDKIDTFISYYLPTTLKLLDKYSQYEKYDTSKNVSDLKKEIEIVIDKLVSGFEKQLDILLIDDVWDVTSDIDVLETMMIRDGLSNSDFKVSC